jgi:predicted RNA-binding Zn ribbon-like protein
MKANMAEIYCGKKVQRRRPARFDLVAGGLCLDFVNTLDDRFTSEPKELLGTYLDLARFGEDTGILSASEVDRLFARSQLSPEEAQSALAAAVEMREAMYAVFWAKVNKKPAPRGELIKLNQFVQQAARHAQLVEVGGRFEWKFEEALNFDAPLWPIARSAAELLASDQLALVRPCAAANCLWLFLDTSKNHRRRWCDMTKCGNRAKFRRFYRRKKKMAEREG